MALNKWVAAVHAHALASGKGISAEDATRYFGVPVANVAGAAMLASAAVNGWFRYEQWTETGPSGRSVRRGHYVAIAKVEQPAHKPDNRTSYFTGVKRVRSVFELGASL